MGCRHIEFYKSPPQSMGHAGVQKHLDHPPNRSRLSSIHSAASGIATARLASSMTATGCSRDTLGKSSKNCSKV